MSTLQKAKIEALKKLKVLLVEEYERHGRSMGICFQLTRLYNRNDISWAVCLQLQNYIKKALGPNAYLNNWLERHSKDYRATKYSDLNYQPRLHATRLAWIDWMIACYEEDLAKLPRSMLTLIEVTEAQKKGSALAA